MAQDVFSVPIFFIIFREYLSERSTEWLRSPSPLSTNPPLGETIEAAIIISVLLSFVEQLMTTGRLSPRESESEAFGADEEYHNQRVKKIIRRMRIQIWAGTFVGFFISLCIGAAFIAVVSIINTWLSITCLQSFAHTPLVLHQAQQLVGQD
jgi:high-affinity iron transporter